MGALALGWALLGAAAGAQVVTDAAGLREIAARLLAQGDADGARAAAEALVARDAQDGAALLILARAAAAEGDWAAVVRPAARAHRLLDGRARFAAARLVARAHFERRQDTRAQVWLRIARQDAPDAEAAEQVARDFRTVRARNPLSVSLSFGVAPTSNVNGGSASDTITLPGLPFEFVLDGEARALSGLRVSAGASLAYRLRRGERSETAVELQGSGRTYVLSAEARDQAPEARGSDFADTQLGAALVHRWRGEGASGPSSVRLSYGWSFFDGEPYTGSITLGYDRAFAVTERDRIDLSLFREWAQRSESERVPVLDDAGRPVPDPATPDDDDDFLFTTRDFFKPYGSVGGRVRWTHALPSSDRVNLSVGLRRGLTDYADVSYDGATLGVGYDLGRDVAGLRLGASAEVEWRDYALSRYGEDGREDRTARLRATVGLPRYEVFGFFPSVGVEAWRTDSSAGLFDKGAVSVDLGLRSSF